MTNTMLRTPTTIRIIRTAYLGPTTHRGSRIKATDLRTGSSVTIPYDHSAVDAHRAAADAMVVKLATCTIEVGAYIGMVCEQGAGYSFIFQAI